MPNVSTPAIVLRHAQYRDNDRMLTLFSPTHGRVEALARGCRKPTAALQSATELFCTGTYLFFQSRDRWTLTGCEVTERYYPLREDYDRLLYGTYLLSACEAAVQPDEAQPALYALLLTALARLTYGGEEATPAGVTAVFLMQFAHTQGYRPVLHHCVRCKQPLGAAVRFDALAGGTACPVCAPAAPALRADTLGFLRAAQERAWQALEDAPQEAVAQALHHLRTYMEGRLERIIKAAKLLPALRG